MAKHIAIGKIGEGIACDYLERNGWSVLGRNIWQRFGEIDIIARSPDKTLVFVEVKAVKEQGAISPEDNATRNKLRRLRRISMFFANRNPHLINKRGWRIDLVTVILTDIQENCSIKIYENV